MDATVDKLESMFQKTDSDLDYLSRKLDAEFASKMDDSSDAPKENPKKLLEKLGEIKQEYSAIVQETKAIQEAQQEAVQFFRSELMTLCDTLIKLQTNVGVEGDVPSEQHEVEEMLGLPLTQPQAAEATSEGATGGDDAASPPCRNNVSPAAGAVKSVKTHQPAENGDCCALSPLERRSGSAEFVEVDEEEFQSVSSLIRGRAKLVDINHTYRILWSRFKDEGDTTPLKPADMFKMGLRVTGQTGEAKLKVLRALKLVSISKTGDVTLL